MLVLFSLQNTFGDLGVRYLAAACRGANVPCAVVWLHREHDAVLTSHEIESITGWLREMGATGAALSVMSIHLDLAVQLTGIIEKNLDLPVIWGGLHPILAPEECLETVQYICVGDGERTLPVWMENQGMFQSGESVDNIWYRTDGTLVKGLRKWCEDLDSIPFPDYGFGNHWILKDGKIGLCSREIQQKGFPWNTRRHMMVTSRGCHRDCTYCCNTALKKLQTGCAPVRHRSVHNIMAEIDEIRDRFPFVTGLALMDDAFFVKPDGWVEHFCREIKERDVQFGVQMHPGDVHHERMKMLMDAGFAGLQMGLQSGSNRVLKEIYHRTYTAEDFVRATRVIDDYSNRLIARTYDVIVDNPMETDDDLESTVRILASLKKPFNLNIFSLTQYPRTLINDVITQTGEKHTIPPGRNRNYLSVSPTILNRLIWLTHDTPSSLVLWFLGIYRRWWGRWIIICYDRAWEQGVRRFLQGFRRHLRRILSSESHVN